jgi:cation transport ATPase
MASVGVRAVPEVRIETWGTRLFFAFGLPLNPMIPAAAITFSSVSVIANAPRLRTTKL